MRAIIRALFVISTVCAGCFGQFDLPVNSLSGSQPFTTAARPFRLKLLEGQARPFSIADKDQPKVPPNNGQKRPPSVTDDELRKLLRKSRASAGKPHGPCAHMVVQMMDSDIDPMVLVPKGAIGTQDKMPTVRPMPVCSEDIR